MTIQQASDQKQRAWETFLRDLPALYTERPGQWVAYQGTRQLGFSSMKHSLYEQCEGQGLEADQFIVCFIGPQEMEMDLGLAVQD